VSLVMINDQPLDRDGEQHWDLKREGRRVRLPQFATTSVLETSLTTFKLGT